MSISTELTRIQTAKNNIKAAIEAKGVTVPSNDRIDQYPQYINQIETGSGTVSLFDYYKTIATVNFDMTEVFPNISGNNYKIPAFITVSVDEFTIEEDGYASSEFEIINYVTIPSTPVTTSYSSIRVYFSNNSNTVECTVSYKTNSGSYKNISVVQIPKSGDIKITIALNLWSQNQDKGYLTNGITKVTDFTGVMGYKNINSTYMQIYNLPMNIYIDAT